MELKKGQEIEIKIDDFAFGGKGISRIETDKGDYIVFSKNTIPGQTVQARIVKKKKSFAECKVIKVIEKSPIEENHSFQKISGGPYISVPLTEQQKFKENASMHLFEKIGQLNNCKALYDEWIASPLSHHYRNKMEYSFSTIRYDLKTEEELDNEFALGFKKTGTWWMVENLDNDSGLFDKELEEKLKDIRQHLSEYGLNAWHPPKKHGFFRHIVVRKSFFSNELLFNLVTSSDSNKKFNPNVLGEFLNSILGKRFAGLLHTINDDVADREKLEKGNTKLIAGKSTIIEKLHGLSFEISMQSFFQTNPLCAEKLYQKVVDYVFDSTIDESKYILDLFCGTGTIGQLIAKRATKTQIIGVDIVNSAIINANKNAIKNELNNVNFICSDVGKFLFEQPQYQDKIDTIVLDPPRAGISPKTLRKVVRLEANRIVYVSCNPATQARDLSTLSEFGYDVKKFSLVDQFPHTGHVESIMLFQKKNS
jgi:23S rRNA (uracil-5-)-methyltransferase RumA